MFQGSLPKQALAMVHEHVASWPDKDIWVPCSGNFTIERACAHLGRPLHSDDITIYSCTLGAFFAGEPLTLRFTDAALAVFPWLEGSLGVSPEQDVAVVMLCSDFDAAFTHPGHAYWERQAEGYHAQWPELVEKSTKKVRDAQRGVPLASFHAEDVYTWVDRIPADDATVSFPPFWTGGYTKMFAGLAAMIDWDPPQFTELDPSRIEHVIETITDREHWALVLPEPDGRLEADGFLRGKTRVSARGKEVWVYASQEARRVSSPRTKTQPILVPNLGPDERLRPDAEVTLLPLTEKQLAQARAMYLNRSITTGKITGVARGVLVDGVLVGVFALNTGSTLSHWEQFLPQPTCYLLSDFPVAPVAYKNLAKLIVYAALSREARLAAETFGNRQYRSVATTAFSQRPVSMKYRGVLDLLSRKDRTDGHPGFALNYGAKLGEWSLADGYRTWYEKHGNQLRD